MFVVQRAFTAQERSKTIANVQAGAKSTCDTQEIRDALPSLDRAQRMQRALSIRVKSVRMLLCVPSYKKCQAVNADVLPRTINNTEQNCHACTLINITVSQCRIQVATRDEACLGDRAHPYQYRIALRCELFGLAFQSHLRSADLKNTLAVRVRKDHSQQHPRVRRALPLH